MNEQVLSIEQMQYLKEIGVDISGASMKFISVYPSCDYDDDNECRFVPVDVNFYAKRYNEGGRTFTLQDMINLMPKRIGEYTLNWYISDETLRYDRMDCWDRFDVLKDLSFIFDDNETIMDVAYKMLCKLAEGGYLSKK